MNQLTAVLQSATCQVGPGYFQLKIDGGDPIYRERVYCYELYHQMRMLWPHDSPFCINGEVDKAAHPILRTLNAGRAKPDFLVHQPGDMKMNHAIIEVKSSEGSYRGIKKDLETMSLFVRKVNYQRAIYLIYGDKADTVAKTILKIAEKFKELAPIELWLHRSAGEPASHMLTLNRCGGH